MQLAIIVGLSVVEPNQYFSAKDAVKECYLLFFSFELVIGIVIDFFYTDSWRFSKAAIGVLFVLFPIAIVVVIIFITVTVRLTGVSDPDYPIYYYANVIVLFLSLLYSTGMKSTGFFSERRFDG